MSKVCFRADLLIRVLMAPVVAASVVLALPSRAMPAELYGLVIGINDYLGDRNDLQGAVNDALDIAAALKRTGAREVITLLDKDASKDKIKSAWADLVVRIKKDDTVIFSFAGHGSQEPEPEGRGDEPDGKNENFLLSGFQVKGEGTRERIVDDEIFEWLKQADDKGVRVVFIADSCHSGSMHRSVRPDTVRYRNGDFGSITTDMLEFPPPTAAKLKETDYANVTFVGATSEDRLTPEVTIGGKKRGALSWAMARALEGRADKNKDGKVTQLELLGFVVPAVHAKVESQQTPQVLPLKARSVALFSVRSAPKEIPLATATEDVLRLAIVGGDASLIGKKQGVSVVADKTDADLIWYVDEGRVDHAVGGKVAENVTGDTIGPVISKWAALKWLKQQSAENPIQVSLPKGNHRYEPGQIAEIEIAGAEHPHLTLFSLPPNGRVDFHIPDPNRLQELTKDWSAAAIREAFRIENPPYGAEHLVAIFSKQSLRGLHAGLRTMGRAADAVALLAVLQESLQGQDYQVGVLDIYTGSGG